MGGVTAPVDESNRRPACTACVSIFASLIFSLVVIFRLFISCRRLESRSLSLTQDSNRAPQASARKIVLYNYRYLRPAPQPRRQVANELLQRDALKHLAALILSLLIGWLRN